MGKIRVLQVINSLEIGGAERVAANIAANLDAALYESVIITIDKLGPFRSLLDKSGIEYMSLEKGPGNKPSIFFKIAREIKKRKIDIITTHNYGALYYGGVGGWLASVRRVLHVDHARAFPGEKKIISEKLLSRLTYKVIAVSNELKQNLIQYEGIPAEHIDIILNGIDEREYAVDVDRAEKSREIGISSGKTVLGVCVRLVEEKGLTYLLDALSILKDRQYDFQVIIAGDGPLRGELERKAMSLGLCEQVRFLGARMDINELNKIIDIYVLASLREGLPLCILEAMAAQCAIVATSVGGVPDVISSQDNGLLVPPRQPREMADAIQYLIDNPHIRKGFGQRSYELFKEQYSARKMAEHYSEYYRRMMEL